MAAATEPDLVVQVFAVGGLFPFKVGCRARSLALICSLSQDHSLLSFEINSKVARFQGRVWTETSGFEKKKTIGFDTI